MKVLLIGATGNVGLRLVPALLTHAHEVTVYVRSSSKLQSLLPAETFSRLIVVEGDAFDSSAIKKAILEHNIEGVVNSAGGAAMAPWGKTDFPALFAAVEEGILGATRERGRGLRVWFMGGMSILYYPGTKTMLATYVPIYLAHKENIAKLRKLLPGAMSWSVLCPSMMTPESTDFSVPTKSTSPALVGAANEPPKFNDNFARYIPFLGKFALTGMNASRYESTLEQNAEFIAKDLEKGMESEWIGQAVGVIDPTK